MLRKISNFKEKVQEEEHDKVKLKKEIHEKEYLIEKLINDHKDAMYKKDYVIEEYKFKFEEETKKYLDIFKI